MTIQTIDEIKNNPKYQALVRSRSRFAWTLSIIMLVVYYTFIMTIAFKPELLAAPISEGSVISIGIPIGIAIILFSFTITGLYVYRANNTYDVMLDEIKAELGAKNV
ncbi:MAG TPA: DUF485 domain-containing protein [Epsilonproteobacteria bacterium]|nr:DUF485 domain-containing protein [Campylobacterota bacterium]